MVQTIKDLMNDIARGADEKKDLEPGRWRTPPKDFIKLNCDGTAFQSQQVASCGGVVRDTLNVILFKLFQGDWEIVLFLRQSFGLCSSIFKW